MTDCIFCKIIAGDIPSSKVYEDDKIYAFKDIHPKAKVHLLVVPRKHIETLAHAKADDAELLSHMILSLPKIAREQGLESGFRTVLNTGAGGGQEVFHMHFHILGGGAMPFTV
ncbi:histidine triad nucleotide-binding protein [Permianibacter aggregans]|uniref:Histidine triad (HIT) family protein n=1 Tax=Permianibacter aggregans TaxID=1510150 RepID=A0A4R6US58_9GAMM|nr:histidine triad nucleotide-binding protein [Permianibacter aggregans]QGX40109.1 histidine triad nucleotide-binding protein [Permianibacter aggregans]TDQ49076.1 histidine triad (HIT) family protein [Permianibacter aggregans]